MNYLLCGPRQYPYTPYNYGYWKFLGGWGSQSQTVLKNLEFPNGWAGSNSKIQPPRSHWV